MVDVRGLKTRATSFSSNSLVGAKTEVIADECQVSDDRDLQSYLLERNKRDLKTWEDEAIGCVNLALVHPVGDDPDETAC
jgi:hypothetical protein